MALTVTISKAEKQDAQQIEVLVNSAYRVEFSKQGWTTEADLLDARKIEGSHGGANYYLI